MTDTNPNWLQLEHLQKLLDQLKKGLMTFEEYMVMVEDVYRNPGTPRSMKRDGQ